MSYQSTVNQIRAAATSALNGQGRFDHGRHVDISQKFDGEYPFIFLYPVTVVRPDSPGFINRGNILIGFWMQDRPDTSTLDREQIIAQMDTLSDVFITALELNDKSRITGVRKEPQYQMYQGTVSGFAIQFTYENYDAC
jgi:hypothetical protein